MDKLINYKNSSVMEYLSIKTSLPSKMDSTITRIKNKKPSKNSSTKKIKGKLSSMDFLKESNKWKTNSKNNKKKYAPFKISNQPKSIHWPNHKLNSKNNLSSKMSNLKISNSRIENYRKNLLLYKEINKSKWSWLSKTKIINMINLPKSKSPSHKSRLNMKT